MRPSVPRTPLGRARISPACPQRRHTGSAVPHPSRRRDRQSSRRHNLSTRTPESPFPAPPSRRSYAAVHAAYGYSEPFSSILLDNFHLINQYRTEQFKNTRPPLNHGLFELHPSPME